MDLGIFVTAPLFNNFQILTDTVANVGCVLLNQVVMTTKLTSEISFDVHNLCNRDLLQLLHCVKYLPFQRQ